MFFILFKYIVFLNFIYLYFMEKNKTKNIKQKLDRNSITIWNVHFFKNNTFSINQCKSILVT